MIAVVQRVLKAAVSIESIIKSEIEIGLVVLLGISEKDDLNHLEDLEWLSKKIVNMRIFSDEQGKMNLSVLEKNGEILLISQFTLLASTKKGNRPSYLEAARPEKAIPLYKKMIEFLEKDLKKSIKTGEFGADMKVSLINDGPVTIVIDSQERK
jgi:D-aminoacyl-tRNA deacylase